MAKRVAQHLVQVHSPVEAIREGAEVLAGVLAELQGPVGFVHQIFEVLADGADLLERRHLTGQAPTNNAVRVGAADVDYACEAFQAITAHVAAGQQIVTRLGDDGLPGEASNLSELDLHRMALLIGRDRRDDGNLVGPAATADNLACILQVGAIDLDRARQGLLTVTQRHGLHELLVDQPGRAVAGAQVTSKGQDRQPRLVLVDQVDRQVPGRQRQLGAVHDRARRQRGLRHEAAALEKLAYPVTDHVVPGRRTAQTAKTLRSPMRHLRRHTLRFGAVAKDEIEHRHVPSELNSVHRQHAAPRVHGCQRPPPQAHGISQVEVFNELDRQ